MAIGFSCAPPVAIRCPECQGLAYHLAGCRALLPRARTVWANVCPDFFEKDGAFYVWVYPTKDEAVRWALSGKIATPVARLKIAVTEGRFDE